jgi:hypothetical protein
VHRAHHFAQVLLRPPDGEAGLALDRVLHPVVERVPGLLEVLGLYHLDALPGGFADAVARGFPHVGEQLVFRGAQVHGYGGVEVEIVAGVAEADAVQQGLRVSVVLVNLGFDLQGVRARAPGHIGRSLEEGPDGLLVVTGQPGPLEQYISAPGTDTVS